MSTALGPLLERSDVLRLARSALAGHEAWLVGGTIRDVLMDRPVEDVDVVVSRDAAGAAHALARAAEAHVFALSTRFGAWRVIDRARRWQADVTPLRGGSIESDLALRDFTVNAMAARLGGADALVDPHRGIADLEARRIRVLGERAYSDDPIRTLRMARLACELEFEVDDETERLAGRHAGAIAGCAAERVFYELRRLIVTAAVLRGVQLMDRVGLVAVVLPELEALKGVEQNPYHHLDVWGHTLAVLESLLAIEREPAAVLGERAQEVMSDLAGAAGDELTKREALRLAALLHDIGKPATRRVADDGRIMFWGHDQVGAELTHTALRRLRASTELARFLADIALHHLRLGFLVHERPLSRRHVYAYLRACEPVELEVTLLSMADRLATRGERTRTEAVEAHLELARTLVGEALDWRTGGGAPKPPIGGNELMRELDLPPGPRVGEILERLSEAAFAGEVSSREDAIALARTLT
jgi:poly(A) polymerase